MEEGHDTMLNTLQIGRNMQISVVCILLLPFICLHHGPCGFFWLRKS